MLKAFHMTLRLSMLVLVLGLTVTAFAYQGSHIYGSDVFTFPVHDENGNEIESAKLVLGGSATLITSEGGAIMLINAHDLTPGDVVTSWWVVFNHPEVCSDAVCGEDDVVPFPGNVEAGVSLLFADSRVVGKTGVALFWDALDVGDTEDVYFGPGLMNPLGAEIHFVLRTHGPVQDDVLEEQLNSLNGGCGPEPSPEPCRDIQFAVFQQASADMVSGDSTVLGNGIAKTWIKLDEGGNPGSIGISLSEDALTGLPTELDFYGFTLALPETASALTPFKHVYLNWEPVGHEPPGIYDVPHFDFHFYTTTIAERQSIIVDPEICERMLLEELVPTEYTKIPGCVPQMGAHWIDDNATEFHGAPFASTFIYGSYDGEVIFLEPMITKAFLETKPSFSAAIRQPRLYLKRGLFYPTTYSVTYDSKNREYQVSLNDFELR